MKRIARFLSLLSILSLLSNASAAFAEDNAFREIFQDAFYGGAAGTLVGAALMAFTKNAANHLDYMAYGAAAGILTGATYGVAKTARSLAELNNGAVKLAMPVVIPDLVESPSTGQTSITWRATLLRGTFN